MRPYVPVSLASNRLLGELPAAEARALEARFEYVHLALGRCLHEPGEPLDYVLFPTAGIVALVHVEESGASTSTTVVGSEGLIGLSALLGGETAMTRALVYAPGGAYRLRISDARTAFATNPRFQALILRFARTLILELSHSAICNLRHGVEQQLCRFLLVCLDRLESDEIQMTHEQIASLLGIRRQGVTETAKKLQERRIISYSRGRMTVLDRRALEARTCECYGLLRGQPDLRAVA